MVNSDKLKLWESRVFRALGGVQWFQLVCLPGFEVLARK